MTSIHDQIVTFIIDKYSKNLDIRPRDLFYNTRKKGLRLTPAGFNLLKIDFDYYSFPIDKEVKVTANHILELDKNMSWPYYITQKQICLFSEEDSVIFKLVDGYENWIRNLS